MWDQWVETWSSGGERSLAEALAGCGALDAAKRLSFDIVANPDSPLLLQPVIPKPAKGGGSPAHDVSWRMLLKIVPSSSPSDPAPTTPCSGSTSDDVVDGSPDSPAHRVLRDRTPTKAISSAAKNNSPAGVPLFFASRFCAWFVRP